MSDNVPAPLDDMMELALRRFHFTAQAERENRKAMKSDIEFYVSDQWDAGIKENRTSSKSPRPCLTVNRLPGLIRQVTNDMRKNMPQINTIPVNDSDEDVAEIFDGMMRHIQENSHAGIAYATAYDSQVRCGKGYFRLVTEYVSDTGFDKEIKIKRIKNALSVYCDPSSIEPDESDAQYKFITIDITHDEFKRRYPNKKMVSNEELTAKGDEVKVWLTDKENVMRIAEYFTFEDGDEKTIYQLADGSIVDELPKGQKPVHTRTTNEKKVVWRMISGVEELDKEEWPGKYIPIIPVIGEDIDVDGKRVIKGMVRDAQDPQRMYNYLISAQVEAIALAPKAPYIAAVGQIEGLEHLWDKANTENWAVLPYNAVDVRGVQVPPPQRQNSEPPIQAMSAASAGFAEDLKAVTGIYDANLGNKSNEISGTAIDARKLQGDASNYHFTDNFSFSILHLGTQLIDLIPKIYDTPRVVRILGADGTSKYKKINQPSDDLNKTGVPKIYDVTQGEYNVVVETGPSYKTKRQQDAKNMTAILQGNPDLWKVAGDIFVKALDFPDAQQLADRLKKALPPALQDPPEGQPELPPQIQQEIAQGKAMIQQLSQEIHKMVDEREQKKIEYDHKAAITMQEIQSRERIALKKMENDIVMKSMGMDGQANHTVMKAELDSIAMAEQANQQAALAEHSANLQPQNVDNSNSQVDNGNSNGTINSSNAG